jgi:ATP-binding cassette, subfamily C, bacterial
VNTSSTTFGTLRRFVATVVAIAPRPAATAVLVTLAASALEGLGLLVLAPLLQLVGVDAQPGPVSHIVRAFAAAFRVAGLRATLGNVLLLYVVITLLQSLLQRRQAVLSAVVQHHVVTALRNRLYRAVAGMRWVDFARTRSSDYTQMLTEEVDRVGTATSYLIDLLVTGLTAVVYLGLAYRVSPSMTSLVLASGAVLALLMRGKIGEAQAGGVDLSTSWSRLYAAISEHLGSLKIAKSFGAIPRHAEMFAHASAEVGEISVANVRSYSRLRQRLSAGSAVMLAVVVYVSYVVLAISTAQLLLLLFLFARLMPRLVGLYERAHALASTLPAFAAVAEIERQSVAAAEPAAAKRSPIGLTGCIELQDVSFEYGAEPARPAAVRRVTFTLAAGATTAIVGPSGSGKTTLADLILGLLVPSQGAILVDGVPLGPERLDAWRAQIGYVAQEPFLLHDTVRANLLWARPEATEDELWHALALASADVFVSALPRGLDTLVGDRGVLVSGGERQRLSLARALLRRPTLLILDEATSSLDSENEARIQQAIDRLHRQMTIVIITHRLSTIRNADVIHVVDGGQLVESGSWHELVALRAGRFRALCRAQGIDDYAIRRVVFDDAAISVARPPAAVNQ